MIKHKIKLYDTYESKVREFVPLVEDEVSIYYCGPTVYNYVHIGNLRPVLTFDLLYRVMEEVGYNVKMVSNYTDIDDKIIKEAQKEHKTEKELSSFYIEKYEEVLHELNIKPLAYHPRVSNYIPEIVDFIDTIMKKGHAYKSHGDIYFRVGDFKDYGSLSKMKVEDLISGARIAKDDAKESPVDFALWKYTDDDGIKFDSKIGLGRPGWHTECVVMINSYFKKPLIDIHGGGFDLKFPHHENEMVQSEAYSGTHLANYWMHVGFINMNNEKMSKSLGNVVLAKDAVDKYGSNAIRYLLLSTYYRSPINFTDESIGTAIAEVNKLEALYKKLVSKVSLNNLEFNSNFEQELFDEFMDYLCDDLNVANALTVLNKIVKEANVELRKRDIDIDKLSAIYNTYMKMLYILGLNFEKLVVTDEDKETYKKYLESKVNKDFETSDKLRGILLEKGLL